MTKRAIIRDGFVTCVLLSSNLISTRLIQRYSSISGRGAINLIIESRYGTDVEISDFLRFGLWFKSDDICSSILFSLKLSFLNFDTLIAVDSILFVFLFISM